MSIIQAKPQLQNNKLINLVQRPVPIAGQDGWITVDADTAGGSLEGGTAAGRRADVRSTAPAGGAPLGNTTKKVSPPLDDVSKRRIFRYFLQNEAARILPKDRIASCSRVLIPGKTNVKLMYSDQVKRAHYKDLMTCGRVWTCPVCAAKITERRREELAAALQRWDGGLVMAHFTFQHTHDDQLKDLRDFLNLAYRRMQAGKGWQRIRTRWGIVGAIASAEVTWGPVNGWHPHKHVLFFTRKKLFPWQVEQLEKQLSDRFCGIVKSLGGYAHPEYGVKATTGEDPKDYVCKWGLDYEMTKAPIKKGREGNYSPFELLELAITGDYQAVALYREYSKAMKGSKQLSYTHGLRKLLGMGDEKTEEELATEEREDAVILALIAKQAWSMIVKQQKRGELLEVASAGDIELVSAYLEQLGLQGGP